MSQLPFVFSLPTDRVLRCPRLLELASVSSGLELELITTAFYDMMEMSIVNPEDFPPFSWFIITDDVEDENMVWFCTDSGIQIAIQIMPEDKSPAFTNDTEMDTTTQLTAAINEAIQGWYGKDKSITPILEEVPLPSNDYLFISPGVISGKFKINEDDDYQPFILAQFGSADEYDIYMDKDAFIESFAKFCISSTNGKPEDLQVEIISVDDAMVAGFYFYSGDQDKEEFTILMSPDNMMDYEVLFPAEEYENMFFKILVESGVDPEELQLITKPTTANNFLYDEGELIHIVEFLEGDTKKIAFIGYNEDGSFSLHTEPCPE